MNTYSKYVPNVFLAKCSEKHEKGEFYHIEGVLNGEIIGNQYDNHELLED